MQGSGITNPNLGEYEFPNGTELVVEAIPSEGWTFSHWVLGDDNFGSQNPLSITIDKDYTIIANFVENPFDHFILTKSYSDSVRMEVEEFKLITFEVVNVKRVIIC